MILATEYYHTILAILFAALAVVLIGVILLQRGKGVGLAGAFGGTGGGAAFGAKTGDVLTWATIALAIFVLTCTVFLNYVFVPSGPGLTAESPAEITSLAPPTADDGAAAPAGDTEAETPAATTDQPADSTAEPTASPDAEAPGEAPVEPAEAPAQPPAGVDEPSSNDPG